MAMTCRGILALPYANRLCLVAGGQRRGQRDPLGPTSWKNPSTPPG